VKIEPSDEAAWTVEFDSEEELRHEEVAHLSAGGFLLRTALALPARTAVTLVLRLAGGTPQSVGAEVVAALAGGLALHLKGDPAAILRALRQPPAAIEDEGDTAEPETQRSKSRWEKLRGMTPPQKILLAPQADRLTRALLVQESDPQVLFALLKNPRLTLDEVVRVAKSTYLSFHSSELILKTSAWFANLDIRVALIQNAKTPLPFALRILPTLPDNEVRAIAKGSATSMALKQAALKRLHGGG
jgi:hypothetical protein